MTTTAPIAPPNVGDDPPGRMPPAQSRATFVGGVLAVFLVVLAATDQGSSTAVKALLGLALGVTLFHSRFGFTSAWRQLVAVGQGRALQAHMLMLVIAVIGFTVLIANGSGLFDTEPRGYVAPITLGLLIGSFLFGLGMQLGGSCASGTLYATGSGHIGVLVTLTGFVAGSGIGVANAGFWSGDGAGFVKLADPFSFTADIGTVSGTVVLVALLGLIAVGAELVIRRRRPPALDTPPVAVGAARFLRGAWPIWVGAVLLGALNVLVLAVSGRPWGVTSAFRLWASKVLDGVGVDVASWAYWDGRAGLDTGLLTDTTTVLNVGIIIGALAASASAGSFALVRKVPGRQIAAGLIGGALMGYGAAFAFGCNIGAYFSGIASGSLHGWVWAVFALVGTWVGLKVRPLFGLSVPRPTDAVC